MRSAGYFLPRCGLIPNTVLTAVIMRHRNSGKLSTKLSGISALMDMDASRNQLPVPANTVEKISLPMPMTKEKEELKQVHDEGARIICSYLDQGKNVVFLTLGDPTVYSTDLYIHKRVRKKGYETEIISGIPSFCAVSARLNEGLVEKAQQLHVIPASYQIAEALELPGTKVLMKAGQKIQDVKEMLKVSGKNAVMIQNCGMPDEKIYRTVEEIPEDAGYYSLIIVKEKEEI